MDRAPDAESSSHATPQRPPAPAPATLGLMLVASAAVAALSARGVIPIGWTVATPFISVAAYLIVAAARARREESRAFREPVATDLEPSASVVATRQQVASGSMASADVYVPDRERETSALTEARALIADFDRRLSEDEVVGHAHALADIYTAARESGASSEDLAEIRFGFAVIAYALVQRSMGRRRRPWRRRSARESSPLAPRESLGPPQSPGSSGGH
jgi:hypothetical protein